MIAPVVAPVSGGAIINATGWRIVFAALAVLTLLMFLGAAVFAKESLPVAARTRGGFGATLRSARAVLANRNYTGYLLAFCFSFAAMFAYISASPFVMQDVMGLSTGTYSLLFGLNALVIVVTSSISAALAGRVAYRTMITIGLTSAALATAGVLMAVLLGTPTVPTLVLFAWFQGSMGFIFANATTLALAETDEHAGTGSAFLGFLQFMLAAAVSPLVGLWGETTATPMAVLMLGAVALAVLAYVTLTRANTGGPGSPAQDTGIARDTGAKVPTPVS